MKYSCFVLMGIDLIQQIYGNKVVIIIDAVNQLDQDGKGQDLRWLPQNMTQLNENVTIVVSCLPGTSKVSVIHLLILFKGSYSEILKRRNLECIQVGALTEEDRSDIVRLVLADYNKKLNNAQLASLLAKKEATNPLYLVVACEELRVFGIFEKISEKISNFAQTVPELFAQVLERLENVCKRLS